MADYQMRSNGGKEAYEYGGGPMSSPEDGTLAEETVRKDASGVVTGNDHDALDMQRLGRAQELRRNFKSLSVLGLATTTMSTWVALLLTSTFSLINGGLAGTIWLYVASWICTFSLAASLAEMSSMAPTSGGQYHWVSEFAPRSQQKFLSYIVGWLAALGWQALIATTAYSAAVLILLMVSIYHPGYVEQRWHESLLMIGIGVIGTFMNTFGAKRLPILEGIVLVVHIFGFFCIIVPLWVLAPKADASDVFGTFSNFGGWPTIGTACYVGTITATGSFAGSDAAAHLAEETKDASKSVPRMIVGTVLLNGVMGLVFIITYVSRAFHLLADPQKLTFTPSVLLHHQHRGRHLLGEALPLRRRLPRRDQQPRRHRLHDHHPHHPERVHLAQRPRGRLPTSLGAGP